ncbi:sensor domain-containing diguanylate cyclase [Paenibacillus wulumuqiensis]|uniref:sensor domain-containing diguanylate cyclase n=1 Tax=Paenibacillus wulumuqiensis TaxID=1567107 RepID=UPI00069689C9|nr:sensor domain-containing diguanylate cyclase [Paenibacillus wulumuqiensis]
MKKMIHQQVQGIRLSTFMGGLAFLVSFLILLSCLFIGYTQERQSIEQQVLELNEIHARELSHITESLVSSMQHSLEEGANYIINHPEQDVQTEQSNLDYFRNSSSFFNAVFLIKPDKTIVLNSPISLNQAGTKLTTTISIDALKAKRPTISRPYLGKINRTIILMTHPLFTSSGEYKGMIAGALYLHQENRLKELLGTNSQKTDGSYFYVVDRKGNIIYHPDSSIINTNIQENKVVQALMQGQSGKQIVSDSKGHTYLAGYSVISNVGWGIVFQTPIENTNIYSNMLIRSTLLYLIPVILLLMLFTFWLSHRLAKPLYLLAAYAQNLAAGHHGKNRPRLNRWNYEARQLHYAIMVLEEETREKEKRLQNEANQDPLTGLLNRRALQSITNNWVHNRYSFAMIILDIDHFKSVNDTYGHPVGDEVLKMLAGILRSQVRVEDLCFRYGGEEFIILLYEVTEQEVMEIAERIRQTTAVFPTPMGRAITISLGVTLSQGEADETEQLLKHADAALYQAKEGGRNRTVFYPG